MRLSATEPQSAALLGDYACNLPLRSLLVLRNNTTIRYDLAELRGARLAYTLRSSR